jgi:hypothetical protein
VHRHKAYQAHAPSDGSLPNTDFLAGAILNLPIWSHMSESIASDNCLAIKRAHAFSDAVRDRLKQEGVKERAVSTFDGVFGGAEGDRTPDLMTASHALSQLSYGPMVVAPSGSVRLWCVQ